MRQRQDGGLRGEQGLLAGDTSVAWVRGIRPLWVTQDYVGE